MVKFLWNTKNFNRKHWGLGIRTSTVTETPFIIHLRCQYQCYLQYLYRYRGPPCTDTEAASVSVLPISKSQCIHLGPAIRTTDTEVDSIIHTFKVRISESATDGEKRKGGPGNGGTTGGNPVYSKS